MNLLANISSGCSGYCGEGGGIAADLERGAGNLPFTGLDLTFIVLSAVLVIIVGFAMRGRRR